MISNNAPKYWEEGKSYLKNLDPKMAELINLFEYPSLKTKDDIFMTLIRSVVGQQISVKAADTVWNRLLEKVTQITPSIITSKDNLELHERRVNSVFRINAQRDYILKSLQDYSAEDYIIHSDNDEIPNLEAIDLKKNKIFLISSLLFGVNSFFSQNSIVDSLFSIKGEQYFSFDPPKIIISNSEDKAIATSANLFGYHCLELP